MRYSRLGLLVLLLAVAPAGCEKNSPRGSANSKTTSDTTSANSEPGPIAKPPRLMADAGSPQTQGDAAARRTNAMLTVDGDLISYAVGNPNFRGRTTVSVTHDGAALVTFTRSGKEDRYQAALSVSALAKLRKTLTSNDPRTVDSARTTGKPDEARIELSLRVAGTDSSHAYWDAEQWKLPKLRALVQQFNEIANSVSNGKVTH